jgi:hypothetical protein
MWGKLALVLHRATQEKNEELQPMVSLKTFLPSCKENGVIGKRKKIT